MNVTHTIVITDDRDGCTYQRTYVDSPDWSADVCDLLGYVLPDVRPDYADARNRYGDGKASGPLFVYHGQNLTQRSIVGNYVATEVNVCTVAIFGRPLADMSKANADAARIHLEDLDDCADCVAYRERRADIGFEIDARIAASTVAGMYRGWSW